MSKKLKFALIGCGRIGARHAENILNYGELVAVCDIDEEKAKRFSKNYNSHFYFSLEDLLKKEIELDVVSICTPNGLHANHTIKSLKAGYHVLCEKPMAIKDEDCLEMIKVAEQVNKHLFIVKQNRFNPPVAAVKKVIEEGKLGKIFNVQLNCFWNRGQEYYQNSTWAGKKDLDGGILFTQFSHFIDLLHWMIDDIVEVESFNANYIHKKSIELEDTGVVILTFRNGAIGTINYTVNSFEKNMEGSLTIFGEKGTIKIGGEYLNVLEYQNIEGYKIENLPQGNSANDYGAYQGSMSNHEKVYQNVVDVLNNKTTISTSANEGLKTVEIINKIYSKAIKIVHE